MQHLEAAIYSYSHLFSVIIAIVCFLTSQLFFTTIFFVQVFWDKPEGDVVDVLFFSDEKMADQELSEILSEYSNLAESEHQSFVSALIHSQNFAATVFSALQIYEVKLC